MSASEIGQLLLDSDRDDVKNTKQLMLESLKSTKDPWVVHSLVDFYIQAQSNDALDILFQVTEPHDKQILDRLCDLMKGSHRLQALMLCGQLVHKQVPWIYNIAKHNIFPYIIKIIKEATDVPILMSTVLLITSVLPMIPVSVKNYLHDIFDGFSRLAKFNLIKPVNVPDVYLVHLQVGVYSLFHRLYGMYPCHFLTYLRNIYSKVDNQQVFKETIMPMLERVRMHPLLVTASKEKEISPERWRRVDVHDIVVDCAKLSLDLIEGSYEDTKCPVIGTLKYPTNQNGENLIYPCITDNLNALVQLIAPKPVGIEDPQNRPIVSLAQNTPFFSPSHVCGLSTPPPGESSQPGTARGTPYAPVIEPSLYQEGSKEKKRLSGLSISLAGIIPSPVIGGSGNSVPPSPLNLTFGTDPSFSPTRIQAARRIDFQHQSSLTSSKSPLARTSSQETKARTEAVKSDCEIKATASEGSLHGSKESVSMREQFMRQQTLGGDTTPTSEQELAEISSEMTTNMTSPSSQNVLDKQYSIDNPVAKEDDAKTLGTVNINKKTKLEHRLSGQKSTENTEGVPDKLRSQLSKDLANAGLEKPREVTPKSESILAKQMSDDGAHLKGTGSDVGGVSIPARRFEHELSQSVPSIYELPHFIESLGETTDEGDDEVSALTGSQMTDSSVSSSNEPTDVNLTAESVQIFMKKVNRIRFNSMNVASRELIERAPDKPRILRANSCPDFEEEACDVITQKSGSSEHKLAEIPNTKPQACTTAAGVGTVTTQTVVTTSVTVKTETSSMSSIASQTNITTPDQSNVTQRDVNVCVGDDDDDVSNMFPYAHMIPNALHVAPFMQCYSCIHTKAPQLDKPTRGTPTRLNAMDLGIEKPYFSTLSPPEILDRQMQLGYEAHRAHAAEMARTGKAHWPILSGFQWSEDVGILRGQILLLHNQLMYERHKRELYAKRNRRLLGRIVNTTALEERTLAMADQIKIQETVISQYKTDLTKREKKYKDLERNKEQIEFRRDMTQKSCMQEIEVLKNKNSLLVDELQEVKGDRDKQVKELQSTRAQLFDTEQELIISKHRADFSLDLQGQIARLNKELLLMGELQQKYQQRLGAVTSPKHGTQEQQFMIDAYKHDLAKTKSSLDDYTLMYDATKGRLHDAEQMLKTKDTTMADLKSIMEEMKNVHKCKMDVLEDKYVTQRRVQQALQGRILDLTAQLQLHEKPTSPPLSPNDSCNTASSAASANEADFPTTPERNQQPM